MKAAVVYGANDIRIAEVPTPSPGVGEVLVRVRGSGVCATDVKILGGSGLPKELPTILGHEVAGEIEILGQGVTGLAVGSRVAVYPIAVCGECRFCREDRHSLCPTQYGLAHGVDGGFAEYVLVPARIVALGGVLGIGDMAFDLAAMIEPVACCLSAAGQCGTRAGDHVLIIGSGPLGLLHLIVSKVIGARAIVADPKEERLAKARELGADFTLNPMKADLAKEVRRITAGFGADVVIAAVGIPSVVEQSLPLVRNGGVFNIFGGTPRGETIQLDPRWLHYGEIVVTGTFAASLGVFKRALEFVKENAGTVSKVISVRCRLEEVLEAVERVKSGDAFKTVIVLD